MIGALVAAAGGAVAIGISLGLFGSGGSILTVPVLVFVLGHGGKVAIAESLGVVGSVALVGAIPYARGGLVDWRSVLLFGIPGMIGTVGGAWVSRFVGASVQLIVFSAVMLGAAALMWRKPGTKPTTDATRRPSARIPITAAEGLAVGALTGFVGVGGGFLIVPALVLLGGLSMHRAVATSLVIIALKSAAGFVKYLDVLGDLGLVVDWRAMAILVAGGICGSLIGRRINARIDASALQRGFAVLLVVMGLLIIVSQVSERRRSSAERESHATHHTVTNGPGGTVMNDADYRRIEAEIACDKSPVGIDAKRTHVMILAKLESIEKRLTALESLSALTEQGPAAIATFVDTLDAEVAMQAQQGNDVDRAMRNGLNALVALGQQLTPDTVDALTRLSRSLEAASSDPAESYGAFGAMRALAHPDAKKALGFAVAFAKRFGSTETGGAR